MWQDWVIMAVQVVFAISLLPTIFHPDQKPTLSTAVMTVGCIILLSLVYATLHLWFATFMALVNAALWTTLGLQRFRLNQKKFNG